MKKVLITGGAGFIGSAIANELTKQGYNVFVIDDLSFGSREFLEIPDERFFCGSILDFEFLENCISSVKPNWVLHLAAVHFIPYCNKFPFESSEINIQGTINLLDICCKMESIEKLFFSSTAAVYAISNEPHNEALSKVKPLDIYGLTKLAGERLFNEFYLNTKIPTIICRFFNAFGPNETNPHLIPEIQSQVNSGVRKIELGNLTPKRDFIHTSDMAIAVKLLLENFEEGIDIFNLGQGKEYSVTEIVTAFEEALNHKIDIVQAPERIRKVEREHLLADIAKLKKFINWEPKIDIVSGIKTLLQ